MKTGRSLEETAKEIAEKINKNKEYLCSKDITSIQKRCREKNIPYSGIITNYLVTQNLTIENYLSTNGLVVHRFNPDVFPIHYSKFIEMIKKTRVHANTIHEINRENKEYPKLQKQELKETSIISKKELQEIPMKKLSSFEILKELISKGIPDEMIKILYPNL